MKIISFNYQGSQIGVATDGYLNATQAGARYNKEPRHFLELTTTVEYMHALARGLNSGNPAVLVRTTRGRNGGTWIHPKLGIAYARWLDPDLAVAFDMYLDDLLHGGGRLQSRMEASIAYKAVCEGLKLSREAMGKDTGPHVYMNEAKLMNAVIFGVFAGRDRDQLTDAELRIITMIENRDLFLLGQGKDYQQRKAELLDYARTLTAPKIGRAS